MRCASTKADVFMEVRMGLLDQVTSAMGGGGFGGQGSGNHAGLMGGLMKLLSNPSSGGIGGLLGKLQSSGIGHKVQSWIGTGANQPVSGHEVAGALGQDHVDTIAREAGVSPQEASDGLAGMLPNLIDRLTPGGHVPPEVSSHQGGGMGGLMDMLKGQFGGSQQ